MREEYISNNLHISAYLYASGLAFLGAVKKGKEYHFKFSPKDRADRLVNSYFLGQAQVNPKELFARLNDLKDIIFSNTYGK